MDWDALFWTPKHKVDTIRTSDVHVYSHLDPMDTSHCSSWDVVRSFQ